MQAVRALYPPPRARRTLQDAENMRALGLTPDQLQQAEGPASAGPIELWPDLADAFDLFLALQTQWRTGVAGPTGLDYSALTTPVLTALGCTARRLRELWPDLQAFERAALELFAERAAASGGSSRADV